MFLSPLMKEHPLTSEVDVRHTSSMDLERPQSSLNKHADKDSESFLMHNVERTSVEKPLTEPRGSDGRPREDIIKTSSKGVKNSLAQSTPCVGVDVSLNMYVTKGGV